MIQRPNIIFILADDLGYGDLGCYGQEKIKTPCIDKIAAEGMLFTNQYGGAPVCGPSRACLLTGMHQGNGYIKGNPVKGEDIPLRKKDKLISEILQENGYETACIGKWGLGNKGTTGYPNNKGFDYFFGYDSHRSCHNYYPEFLLENNKQVFLEEGTYSHHLLTKKALDWLDRRDKQPFFMYLAYTLPHSPYNPPNNQPYASKSWPEKYKNYAAMVSMLDSDVGRILDFLKGKGMDENTLVFFASDNGPGSNYTKEAKEMVNFFKSAGHLRGMKRDVYEGGIRVPFIAWWPKIIKKGKSNLVTAFQDILPTICDLIGENVPSNVDGLSIVPTLLGKGKQETHDKLYWEFIYMGEPTGGRQACYDWKTGFKGIRYGSKGKLQLFNLHDDEEEKYNIASQNQHVVEEHKNYLDTIRTDSSYWPMPEFGWKPPQDI